MSHPPTPSSPAALQSSLQNAFSSVKDVWLDEEALCFMDPELFITDGWGQHEVTDSETSKPVTISDMFQHLSRRGEARRTVVTKGSSGIGKSFLVQKFLWDWAEKRASQEFHLVFPLDAHQLCLWRGEWFTLAELIHAVVPGMSSSGIAEETLNEIFSDLQSSRETSCEFKLLFVIDGLDQNLLKLDFISRANKSDVRKSTRVEVLLDNLIMRKLLPSAHLWITTQPAAANRIPPECVGMVTELRGFSDLQKEEYFRKRFRDEAQASRIVSHIKTSQSVRIMCGVPVFCWITAAVLQDLLETREGGDLPTTLTEMYTEFLVVQINHMKKNPEQCIKCIKSLAKLAFQQLLKDNTVITEEDVRSCGLVVPSERHECFTEIFKQFSGKRADCHQKMIFYFSHSSIQKFLAAVHVITSLLSSNRNVMPGSWRTVENQLLCFTGASATRVHKIALRRALDAPNGKLDWFLRFVMGLSLHTNQILLHDLLAPTGSTSWSNQKIVWYIKRKIRQSASPKRLIVMFHCLNELRDESVVEEIQLSLRSGHLPTDKLSPAQWSALVFILMSSEKHLDEFDLNKYSASEEVLLQLLPVLKASSKAVLSGCKLSERSLEVLSLVLSSHSSNLKELDLSDNDLQDSGVKLLCVGLQGPNCKLESLRMSGCLITEAGCDFLASALKSNPSHLKELDLSYNHPGESGMKQLVAGLEDPNWRLKTLRLDCCGELRLQPAIRKYACELELDSDTANKYLRLSSSGTKVEFSTSKRHLDHPERFNFWPQVLCKNALSSRCYWEVEWTGLVDIAVSYRSISRKGNGRESLFGGNKKSWSLACFFNCFAVFHNKQKKELHLPSCVSNRVAVYVDHPAGILSFYVVSSGTLIHLHTFRTTFTQPLYAGFGCDRDKALHFLNIRSSVSICPLLADESVKPAAEQEPTISVENMLC